MSRMSDKLMNLQPNENKDENLHEIWNSIKEFELESLSFFIF